MSAMTYKGYSARVEFDPRDQILVGHIAAINDIVGFHADSAPALTAAFREAVDDYIETCAKAGKSPEKPFSGKLMLRTRPEVHAQAVLAAQLSGQSLNAWAEQVLEEGARRVVGEAVPV
jgi:predicted HicB family RNase H-like nuclease